MLRVRSGGFERWGGDAGKVALLVALFAASSTFAEGELLSVSVRIPVGAYEVKHTQVGDTFSMEGFGRLHMPGAPALPSRIFAIALPPGAEVVEVSFEAGEVHELPGSFDVRPSPLPKAMGEEIPAVRAVRLAEYEANFQDTYASDAVYPPVPVELVGTAGYRGYNLVDVRVTPLAYRPLSRRVTFYPELTVRVHYRTSGRSNMAVTDCLVGTERIAGGIILNYEQAACWYEQAALRDQGLHDFVVITLDTLTSAVTPLVEWETAKGRTVEVVTTSWIDANYKGYDLAEKIRNFLRDKYPSSAWGIEDVLLVGHWAENGVPMRLTAQDVGYGRPRTDFYYAELSWSDALSWDADGDHLYGGDGDPIDFYSEVNVGRIPWSDPQVVEHICRKSVAYEQNNDASFRKNALLLGAFFWEDTDNAILMEMKIDQPWMSEWTFTRLYEKNAACWSSYACDYPLLHENVLDAWTANRFGFVNWAGHGLPDCVKTCGAGSLPFVESADCGLLDDSHPAVIFACACNNSDTDYISIGQEMLRRGGVGFVGATEVAWGVPRWDSLTDGLSQSFDYLFTKYFTSGEYSQGAALQRALTYMYTHQLWGHPKYETFEWAALWGNPHLRLLPPLPLHIELPDGAPQLLTPGVGTTFPVRISNNAETYVPGSGLLHYRYGGGDFLTTPLASCDGDLYQATLPATNCGAEPEFYLSAQGDGGSTAALPLSAPAEVYAARVGVEQVIMQDDFETDQGWSVEKSPGLSGGMWERGVPVGDGSHCDPVSDFDGSGQCYLTQNRVNNSDVDNGFTWLISPALDLSEGDAEIQYAVWYANNCGGDPNNDVFIVSVSNDDGVTWTDVQTIGPGSLAAWTAYSFNLADFVAPSAEVRVRFEVSDLNGASTVEAAVDGFRVVRLICDNIDCPADLDYDGDVDLVDLSQLLSNYLTFAGVSYSDGDLDGDGDVDLVDLATLLTAYGSICW